jgi:hypothetical protein
VLAFAALPGAAGATRWSTPRKTIAGHYLEGQRLESLADGTTVAFADERNAPFPYGTTRVRAAVRPRGGDFRPDAAVTGYDEGFALFPSNVASESALLTRRATDGHTLMRRRLPGASFGIREDVSDQSVTDAVLGPSGDLNFLTWGDDSVLELVTRTASGITTKRAVHGTGSAFNVRLGVAPDGTAVVVWQADGRVRSATAPPGLAFGEPTTVATEAFSSLGGVNLTLVQDARGDMLAAWTGGPTHGMFEFGALHTSYRPAGGAWRAAQRIPGDPFGNSTYELAVAMNARGDAVIAWDDAGTAMSYRRAGGAWEHATAPERGASDPSVAVGPGGEAVVAYSAESASAGCLEAIDRPAGGSFGSEEPVLEREWPSEGPPQLAATGGGEAVIAWGGRQTPREAIGIWSAVHRVAAAPTAPRVTCFRVWRARRLRYRLTRAARVEVRVRRIEGSRRPRVGRFVTRGVRGGNDTPLPAAIKRKLVKGRTYAVEIAAIDRAGRRTRSRVARFTR